MDRLLDLLADDPSERQSLDIRCHPTSGVTVPHLTEVVVENIHMGMRLIHLACRRRTVTQTSMNAVSSRGHAIFQVTNRIGTKLCIVDLAGRENERTTRCQGQSLAELGYINKSLFHLTSVIQALARPISGGVVPFRNSRLTLLLSESLQCARTFLLATASPVASSFDETLATLRLAQSVRQITTRSRCERSVPQEVPSAPVCTGAEPQLPPASSQKSRATSSERNREPQHRQQGSRATAPIPFAPRLQAAPVPNAAVEPRGAKSSVHAVAESRPARFRLDAWKQSCSSASSGSTAAADSRSLTEMDSDSSFYEVIDDSRFSIVDDELDSSYLVGEVVEAMLIHELPWCVS